MIKKICAFVSVFSVLFLVVSCSPSPPAKTNNICSIFQQNPRWYKATKRAEQKWHVPVTVQMAIMNQESSFNSRAKPPRGKLLFIIPWKRPSNAVGYAQSLSMTWKNYERATGRHNASRNNFADACDFIGWFASVAKQKAGIPPNDAYRLYLAYHEGVGGYQRKTYQKKPWLMQIAHKVSSVNSIYALQLKRCG